MTSQLDLLAQLTNDLERFILPNNQTIININNGEFGIIDVYRRLLKAIVKVKGIHKAELIDELDNIYLKLPEGSKSAFFSQKVRKLGDRLTSLRVAMLDETEPLIEDLCKEWIIWNDEQAKRANLSRAIATHRVKKYKQPNWEPFYIHQFHKESSRSFNCLDSKGLRRSLSTIVDEPVITYTPSAEDIAAMEAAQSTLRLILGIEPFVETERTLGYRPPASIQRAIRHMYNLNHMLYDPIDVLTNFIRNSVLAQAEVDTSHLNVSQSSDYMSQRKTASSSEVKASNDFLLDVKTPKLSITKASKQAVYNTVKEYVICNESGEAPELRSLIFDGLAPSSKIILTCQQNEFGAIFYHAKAIPHNNAKLLSEQLPNYFLIQKGENILPLKSSILYKHLRGESLPKR